MVARTTKVVIGPGFHEARTQWNPIVPNTYLGNGPEEEVVNPKFNWLVSRKNDTNIKMNNENNLELPAPVQCSHQTFRNVLYLFFVFIFLLLRFVSCFVSAFIAVDCSEAVRNKGSIYLLLDFIIFNSPLHSRKWSNQFCHKMAKTNQPVPMLIIPVAVSLILLLWPDTTIQLVF